MKTRITMLVVMIVMTLTASAQTYYGDNYMMRRVNGSMYVCTTNNDMFEVSVMQRPTSVNLPNGRRACIRKAVPTMSGGWCFLTNTGHYGQLYTGGSIDWDRKYSNVVNAKPRQYKGGYDYDFNRGYGYGGYSSNSSYGNGGYYGDEEYSHSERGISIFGVTIGDSKTKSGNYTQKSSGFEIDSRNFNVGVYNESAGYEEEKSYSSNNSSNRGSSYNQGSTSSRRNSEVKEVVFGSQEWNNMMSKNSSSNTTTVKTQKVEKTQKAEKNTNTQDEVYFVNGVMYFN